MTIVLTFAASWFWFSKNKAEKRAAELAESNEKVIQQLAEMQLKLARIDQVVVPINTMMQQLLVKELTHYHEPVTDRLLAKLGPPNTLTEAETKELAKRLDERTRDMGPLISESERGAATILPFIIQRSLAEQRKIAVAETVKASLVSVVSVVGVPATVAHDVSDKP